MLSHINLFKNSGVIFVVQWQQNWLIIKNVHLNLEFQEVISW